MVVGQRPGRRGPTRPDPAWGGPARHGTAARAIMAIPVVRARPRRPGSGRWWQAGAGPGPAAGLCRWRRVPGKPCCRLVSSAPLFSPSLLSGGGGGGSGVVVRLGAAASGPPLPAPSRRPLRASGEAAFDLHFLLSHGARAASSPVTPRSRSARRRGLQRGFSCVSSSVTRGRRRVGSLPPCPRPGPAPTLAAFSPTAPARSLSPGGSSLGAGDRSSPPGRAGKRRRAGSRRPGGKGRRRGARPRVALRKRV